MFYPRSFAVEFVFLELYFKLGEEASTAIALKSSTVKEGGRAIFQPVIQPTGESRWQLMQQPLGWDARRPAMQQNRVPWRGGPVSGDARVNAPLRWVFSRPKGIPNPQDEG